MVDCFGERVDLSLYKRYNFRTMEKQKDTKTVVISEEHWLLLNDIQSKMLKKTGDKLPLSWLVQEGITMLAKKELIERE